MKKKHDRSLYGDECEEFCILRSDTVQSEIELRDISCLRLQAWI
jgi:hypothetical protein